MADWDATYTRFDAPFGDAPSAGVEALAAAAPGARSALCLADGDGRNGRWLARRGLAVTAVDLSDVATRTARARDGRDGVTVERIAADLAQWEPPADRRWDLACVVFLQCEAAVRLRAVQLGWAHLSPGGLLLAEGFSAAGAAPDRLGPKDADKLYDAACLRAALDDSAIVDCRELDVVLDDGPRHQGPAQVLRLMAEKLRA
jgi:hypothetical protein